MITATTLDICSWCARSPQAACGHPVPDLGVLEWHRITLPYPDYPKYPALSLNGRRNRFAVNSDAQAVRADVARLARPIRPGKHLVVHLAWSPRRRAGQDADNLAGLLKVCCDSLARGPRRPTLRRPDAAIGLDLVPDDTPEFVTKLMPVILPAGEPPGMWLSVGVAR